MKLPVMTQLLPDNKSYTLNEQNSNQVLPTEADDEKDYRMIDKYNTVCKSSPGDINFYNG